MLSPSCLICPSLSTSWLTAIRPRKTLALASACAVFAALLCGAAPAAPAQTAHFAGVQTTLANGFSDPAATAVDSSGNVYVADMLNHAVKEILAVNGSIPVSPTIRTLGSGFIYPITVAVDGKGNVYVGDQGNGTINQMLAVNGSIPDSPSIVTLTTIANPQAVAVDAGGNVYVSGGCNGQAQPGLQCGFVEELLTVNGAVSANSGAIGLPVSPSGPGGVAVDGSGNVYVADTGNNQVDEVIAVNGGVTINSATKVLTTFTGPTGPGGVAVDGSGNVFISDAGTNQLYELRTVSGVTSSVPLTLGTGFNLPAGLAVDGKGNVYLADVFNNRVVTISLSTVNLGSVNVGVITSSVPLIFNFDTAGTLGSIAVFTQGATGQNFVDTGAGSCSGNIAYTAGQSCTVSVDFTPTFPGTSLGAVALRDTNGKVIAAAPVQSTGIAPQINFLPGTQSTVIHDFTPGNSPASVAADGAGNIYVADADNGIIWKEVPGAGGYTKQGPIGSGFKSAFGVAVDLIGNIYVADSWGNAVYKETPSFSGYSQSLISNVSVPTEVAVDATGNVYISSTQNNLLLKEIPTANGYIQTTVPTNGLNQSDGVAVDAGGNVYISDTYNGRVLKEMPVGAGYVQSVVASGLGQPQQLAVDGNGAVYIADATNNVVLKETPNSSGYVQTTLANAAVNGLSQPDGVAVDAAGNVYIAGNYTVFKEDFIDPPSLAFTSTSDGTTTVSSSQTLTVGNVGNLALNFPILSATNNPSTTGSFTINQSGSSSCPVLTPNSFMPATLAAGAFCQFVMNFVPPGLGSYNGSLGLTDDSLNAVAPGYASQVVSLSGAQVSPTFTVRPSIVSGGLSQGASLTSTITITPQAGYNVNATLSVSGLPSGVTASFSPNPTNSSSVLTLTASATATPGDCFPTLIGTAGTQTASVPMEFDILAVPPGFTLSSSPANIAVLPGSSPTSTISIATRGGFSDSVNLVASSLPSGLTASFSPSATTSDSVLTLTVSNSLAPGFYPVIITGTSGTLSATTVVGVTVQSTPTITWPTPSPIVYGTALSATQLNASSTVAGTFTYAPLAGTVLNAGPQTLSVTFTPTDTLHYTTATATVTQTVNQASASITWPTPTAITYGTALSAAQLNATSSVPGTFAYSPAAGTLLSAGSQTLTATFTPTDTVNYASVATAVSVIVKQVAPSVIWATPASITYGATLGAAQLNATANVPGTFVYSPAAGTIPPAGTDQLTVTFTPTDTTNYTTVTATVTVSVNKTTPQVTWATPAPISYGTALGAAQLNASSTVPGTFSYAPAAGTVLAAGTSTVTVTFTPTDTADYTSATATVTLTVNKVMPTVTWVTPAPIVFGTPLTATQLNATSTVAGTFSYSPSAGTLLNAGQQTLSITFMPTDTTDYAPASATVTLTVTPATPTITWPTPTPINSGTALSATQLNATANLPGTFVYSPAAGTIPAVGTDTLTVTFTAASANYTTTTASVLLTVLNPGFTLSAAPSSLTVGKNGSGTSTISVAGFGGFSGSVHLTASGVPAGVTATFGTNPATAGSALTLKATAKAIPGTSTVTITGTSGGLTSYTTVTLTITR